MSILLVLGGASSGKSDYALEHCNDLDLQKIYIATAQTYDKEMANKIKAHQNQRDASWQTINAPKKLAHAIVENANDNRVVLVDCLTMWLYNILLDNDGNIDNKIDTLLNAVSTTKSPIVFVSNEVGMGLVPDNELGRKFRDIQGTLNKKLAKISDKVVFIASGLPIPLKE